MRKAYAAHNRNPAAVQLSSSGGVFPALAGQILRTGGAVYGVSCDENGHIGYRCVERSKDLPALLGSKYVFVSAAPILEEVAERTANGQTVMVVVSPCQAAALRRICGETERLILVDFICHGAPSMEFWEAYREECGREHGSELLDIRFRKKVPGRSWQEYQVMQTFADGSVKQHRAEDDPYMQTFLRNASLRRACASCKAKGSNRASDLTLGDFWGIKKLAPKYFYAEGTSLVFVNTSVGERLWAVVSEQLEWAEVDAAKATQYNPSADQPAELHPQYDAFWQDAEQMTVRELAKKYCRPAAAERIKHRIRRVAGRFRR